MALALLNLGNGISVDIASLEANDVSNFVAVDTTIKPDGARETVYQQAAGSEEYPLTVRVGYYPSPQAEGGVGRVSISCKISTYLQKTDADSNIVWTLPAHATLAFSLPGGTAVHSAAEITELLGNLFTWVLPVASGAVTTSALDELKFGITNGLTAHVNSASV